jgi:hypothetical protein
MDAVHHAGHERFHFVLIDVRHLIPGEFPAFGIDDLHVGIVARSSDWRDTGMELFKVASPNAGSGLQLGKFALRLL